MHNLKIILKAIIFVYSFFVVGIANANIQNIKFEHINSDNGLPASSITCLDQDQDGFIWMGSMEGIIKYNGYDFKIFRHILDDSLSISGHLITDLHCAPDDKVYIAVKTGGLSILDPKTEQFTNRVPPKHNTYETITINKILPDSIGNLWLASNQGVYYFNTKTLAFRKLDFTNPSIEFDTINNFHEYYSAITFDANHNLLILGHKGSLLRYTFSNKQITPIKYSKTLQESVFLFNSGELHLINDSILWIGTENNGIFLYDFQKGKSIKHLLPGIIVSGIKKIDDKVWVATDGKGVEIYSTNGELQHQITNNPYNHFSISSDAVYCCFKTRDNTIMIGNYSTGLNVYNATRHKFDFISNIGQKDYTLTNKSVLANIQINENQILIGTDGGGINCLDVKSNKITPLHIKNQNIEKFVIKSFCLDKKNKAYVGTYGKGLFYLEMLSENEASMQPLKHDIQGKYKHVWTLSKVSDSAIWIGYLNAGLCIYNPKTKQYKVHEEFNDKNIISITKDGDNIWVSAEQKGIYLCNSKGEIINYYHNYDNKEYDISSSFILDVYTDSKERIWMGTSNGGLNLLDDLENGIFNIVKFDQVLTSSTISNIEEDKTGTLWLTTNVGLIQFNPDSKLVKIFDKKDGLPSTNFAYASSLNRENETFYFGSVDGLIIFEPKNIITNDIEPQIAFTNLRLNNKIVDLHQEINGRVILNKPLAYTKTLNLDYTDNDFTIEFSALHFVSPEKNAYQYMLEGFNNTWITCDPGEHSAKYTNLKKGTFIFKVKAANPDEQWNHDPIYLTINVDPPFYLENWFYSFIALLLILGIYLFIRWRTHKLKHEKNKLRELVKLKTQALHAKTEMVIDQNHEIKAINNQLRDYNVTRDKIFSIIAHDLRNPLNAIVCFSKMLDQDFKSYSSEQVTQYIGIISETSQNMSDLITNLLYWVNNQIGKIEALPTNIILEDVFTEIEKISQANAFQKKINILFNHNNLNITFDKDMLVTVLRNLVSNSIKFTPENGSITITAKLENNTTTIAISDTGVGMSPEQIIALNNRDTLDSTKGTENESGTGLGLFICKDFTEKNNGKFIIESQKDKGTTIKIILSV